MSDEIESIIQHADADTLLLALAKRGATTRPVAGGMVKVSLRLPATPQASAPPLKRKRARRVPIGATSLDPAALGLRTAKGSRDW